MRLIDNDGNVSQEILSIIENTNDLMFVKNKDFVYIAASSAFSLDCAKQGSVGDVIGKTDFDLFEDNEIAARYRADDERLFASGEQMVEFQEEYPDRNGKKHLCLTTKYLLHDEDGNPAAIFGQYHDIGEHVEAEISRRRFIDKNIVAAMSSTFFASNYVDLTMHTFEILRAMDYSREMLERCSTIEEAFDSFVSTLVKPEFQPKMRDFCNADTIAERLKGEAHIDCEYLSTVAAGWCRTTFLPTEWDDEGNVTHVLFAICDIDEEKAKEIEEGISSKKSLEQKNQAEIDGFERQVQRLLLKNADALCMCRVNLSKNTFSDLHAQHIIKHCAEGASSFDEFLLEASNSVFVDAERESYQSTFNCEELLERYSDGDTHISLEHFFRIDQKHTEWVETVVDVMGDPVSGDVVGICYARSLNLQKMSRVLLDAALENDYIVAALVYANTGEYYRYESRLGDYCVHRQDYFGTVYSRVANLAIAEELDTVRANLSHDVVLSRLFKNDIYTYAFYATLDGEERRLEATYSWIDADHELVLATLRDITDSALYEQYKYESEHDSLTGLLTREALIKRARAMLAEHPEKQFVVVHCDVRHFHLYNTFFGEEAGNELLCAIADSFRKMGEDYDCSAYSRIESDVFCAFFPLNEAVFEEHVRTFLRNLTAFRDDFPLRAYIGAYWVSDSEMPVEAMFARATIAAKSGTVNLFDIISRFDDKMEESLQDAHEITSEMNAAIAEEQFEVYLQPKYSLRSESLVGAEALVRWNHPKRGMISPGKFIPAFETNGFIADLDRYMWEHVCQILRGWQDRGERMLPISVNMSRVSLYSHATVPFLKSLIEKYGIESRYMELELTESAYIDDPEDLKRMLSELQEFGFRILMDDFGSGYSSLNTLRELPVDVLKLDMKFLAGVQSDERGAAVLSSVVRMSKMLQLPIVAEGVEEREHADYLREIGCEYVQGYLFAKPMPVSDFEELLKVYNPPDCDRRISYGSESLYTPTDIRTVDPLLPVGILEYQVGHFAYLHANKRFMEEFDLIENLAPASAIFREHLTDDSYSIFLDSLSRCSETGKQVLFKADWRGDDGSLRAYCGYLHYNGNIGEYSDLSVAFVNVGDIEMIGFDS